MQNAPDVHRFEVTDSRLGVQAGLTSAAGLRGANRLVVIVNGSSNCYPKPISLSELVPGVLAIQLRYPPSDKACLDNLTQHQIWMHLDRPMPAVGKIEAVLNFAAHGQAPPHQQTAEVTRIG